MNYSAAPQAYKESAVLTATPERLVVMLYDGAIAAISRAITALEARDIAKKCAHLERALAIICQLEGSLDYEEGGGVAQTLKQFYVHARGTALRANIQNSKELLASLLQQFSTVREAWAGAERAASSSSSRVPNGGSPRERSHVSDSSSLHLKA